MRERTTWNREQIVKLANSLKKAEDPRAMNQDHLSQQPAADKYEIGGPSEFGEDVAAPNWKAEYSGGEVKRNEVGMPEMRSETFTHAEKTAGQQEDGDEDDDDFLEKKADVCLDIARKMLPKSASKQTIEDQAFAFMHMADADIVATAARLAAQQDEEKKEDDQAKEAGQVPENFKKDEDKDDKGQQQAKEGGQIPENFKKKDDEEKGQQDKEAGQIPENFKKKDDEEEKGQQQAKEAQGQQDQGKDDEQQKKEAAINDLRKRACDALMQGDQTMAQQLVQQMSQMQQAPQQQQQMSQQQAQEQIDQMLAQAQQGQQGQPQQVMATDDQLLDRMLAEPKAASTETSMLTASPGNMMDIQLEGPSMDMTEVRLGSEDEALTALFASNDEVQQATQAHALQTGIPVQASGGMTRTASTRTVGTRPTGGVAQLGGASAPSSGGGEIDKLAGLWASAPDVKSVFDT